MPKNGVVIISSKEILKTKEEEKMNKRKNKIKILICNTGSAKAKRTK